MERLKILVVDDESRMRKLVRDFLVKKDFEVLEAGDGEEALEKYSTGHFRCNDAKDQWLGCVQGNP